ncbi:MAG: CocE/NonD family hydrolase [Segetibacter sp.]|nr:CocE/NonD family hydrolase [Segetibacter sp.]
MKYLIVLAVSLINIAIAKAQPGGRSNSPLAESYIKVERQIPMRDGVKLFTAIYIPKDTGIYPILMERTPYSVRPYGVANYRQRLGPSAMFANQKFIYVYQDVRGRYMSEGKFEEMTPQVAVKKTKKDVDESSDAYDTVDWLLKNISNNNGKVGIYGISYPGFYATASLINAHPAVKAVSPQAPVTDEFEGDDAYHRGAFFLMDNFSFMNFFDHPREKPWQAYPQICNEEIKDAYAYYLKMGPIKNANTLCFSNKSKIWNEYLQHDTKDAYWQARDLKKHLKNIKPAVLVVGGWYDAEDLYGALNTYQTIEKGTAKNNNKLIMGPWTHGAWSRPLWDRFGSLNFGANTSGYFQQQEFDFFNYHLKGQGKYNTAEATIFITGKNEWKNFNTWPAKNVTPKKWYLTNNKKLSLIKPSSTGFDSYVSDPANPVPYMKTKGGGRNNEYMVADQTCASQREDVLTYVSEVVSNSITIAGPITADLFVSTTGTDADFIVKVIDVLPDTATDAAGKNVGGQQQLVRAEVIRAKFRNSYTKPEPFVPGKVTNVKLVLNDVAHCFKPEHKIMVQVQSSWFPLVDRNPQKFLSIPKADASDFQKATIKLYHDAKYPSSIQVLQLQD